MFHIWQACLLFTYAVHSVQVLSLVILRQFWVLLWPRRAGTPYFLMFGVLVFFWVFFSGQMMDEINLQHFPPVIRSHHVLDKSCCLLQYSSALGIIFLALSSGKLIICFVPDPLSLYHFILLSSGSLCCAFTHCYFPLSNKYLPSFCWISQTHARPSLSSSAWCSSSKALLETNKTYGELADKANCYCYFIRKHACIFFLFLWIAKWS